MLLGHLAVSALLHRYLKVDLSPALLAGVFPDIVDKTLCQVLHLTQSGRFFAHTLAVLGLSTIGIGLVWGWRKALSWALGYLGHLLCDISWFVPWLYPFVQYDFPVSKDLQEIIMEKLSNPVTIILEMVFVIWAASVWYKFRIVVREC